MTEDTATGNTACQDHTAANAFLGLHYMLEPDYVKPGLAIPREKEATMRHRLQKLYGADAVDDAFLELKRIMAVHHAYTPPEIEKAEKSVDPAQRLTEKDVVLITYGDLIVSKGKRPLQSLADFTHKLFRGLITTMHILPFFPYSSDRGFSVVEYGQVDPELGTWRDIAALKNDFKLMFDGVINHCSSQCKWFRRFLGGDPKYNDFFVVFDSDDAVAEEELKKILRPRTSALLTKFDTLNGPKYVWTTFSRDQVDLNFKNPLVLLKIFRILLGYVRRGADIIRLDAITYLWRELGTTCAHLEQTHEVVKLLRDVMDVVAPHVVIITETNVPHSDNITYFGNGRDEAQMVYNFALPPLVLHTFLKGDSTALSGWAKDLVPPSKTTSFFNFLDSHDGIGILGAKDYLSEADRNALCDMVRERSGFVSMKSNGDGTESPYELNITWFNALNSPSSEEPQRIQVGRFLASRAVALMLRGVPGIYMLGMFASKNDLEAVARDGSLRSINRSALYEDKIMATFMDRNSIERRITSGLLDMLEQRVSDTAFHPNAYQEVYDFGPSVFALKRTCPGTGSSVFCIINVTDQKVTVDVPVKQLDMGPGPFYDMLTEGIYEPDDIWHVALRPYRVAWFKPADQAE